MFISQREKSRPGESRFTFLPLLPKSRDPFPWQGSIEFDEEPETEEEDEGQDDVLAAAGLETGVDASLTLAQQIRNIPEGPDQSEQ